MSVVYWPPLPHEIQSVHVRQYFRMRAETNTTSSVYFGVKPGNNVPVVRKFFNHLIRVSVRSTSVVYFFDQFILELFSPRRFRILVRFHLSAFYFHSVYATRLSSKSDQIKSLNICITMLTKITDVCSTLSFEMATIIYF